MNHLENNLTYTDFFAALMNDFFQEEGLLLIDAAYEPFRKLESEYFQLFVENASELAEVVFEKEKEFEQSWIWYTDSNKGISGPFILCGSWGTIFIRKKRWNVHP